MTAATAVHKLTTQRKENPTIRAVEGWPWDASMKVIAEGGGSYQEVLLCTKTEFALGFGFGCGE